MSYFNVFFQAAICHSWFLAAKLRLKKRSYGHNCDHRILKKHKKSVGERIDVNTIIYLALRENKISLKTKYILSSDGLCIRVHAREEIVHTEVGHGDTQEG